MMSSWKELQLVCRRRKEKSKGKRKKRPLEAGKQKLGRVSRGSDTVWSCNFIRTTLGGFPVLQARSTADLLLQLVLLTTFSSRLTC